MIHPLASIGGPPEHRDRPHDFGGFFPLIDETATVNAFVTVDAGMEEPTRIGARTFLMAHAHVGHDAQIGENCELAPGTVIGGHAILEDGVRCGIGVLVLPGKRVGKAARLGAGAVITRDVPAGEVWIGNPAKPFKRKEDDSWPEVMKKHRRKLR